MRQRRSRVFFNCPMIGMADQFALPTDLLFSVVRIGAAKNTEEFVGRQHQQRPADASIGRVGTNHPCGKEPTVGQAADAGDAVPKSPK